MKCPKNVVSHTSKLVPNSNHWLVYAIGYMDNEAKRGAGLV